MPILKGIQTNQMYPGGGEEAEVSKGLRGDDRTEDGRPGLKGNHMRDIIIDKRPWLRGLPWLGLNWGQWLETPRAYLSCR